MENPRVRRGSDNHPVVKEHIVSVEATSAPTKSKPKPPIES